MKRILYIITAILAAGSCWSFSACNKDENCVHEYEAVHKTDATCTKEGELVYICKDCGKEKTKSIPAKGHTPGAEPTLTQAQTCLTCGQSVKPALSYMPYYGKDIPLNHYYGQATEFYRTEMRTRNRQAYTETLTYATTDGGEENLELKLPLQEFFKQEVLSPTPLKCVNAKEYQSTFGFKVEFTPQMTRETEKYKSFGAWESGLGYQVDADALWTVYSYQATNIFYNDVYLLADLSNAYLQVSKQTGTGYEPIATLSGLENWAEALEEEKMELTAEDGGLFKENGKYRVAFVYDLLWVATPSQAVLTSFGGGAPKAGYPFGFINPQSDFFYVEVVGENHNILLPSNVEEVNQGTFCQVRGVTAKNEKTYIEENATLNFDTVVQLGIQAKVDMSADGFFYEGQKISDFSAVLSYYDEDTESYQLEISYDLTDKITERVAMGEEIILDVGKSVRLRNAPCRMVISYTVGEGVERVTYKQIYKFTMNW